MILGFVGHDQMIIDIAKANETLYKWVNAERFPTFPKVTRGNIKQLFLTNKNLVLAVVEENQLEEIAPDMLEFKDMVESVIKRKRDKYHEYVTLLSDIFPAESAEYINIDSKLRSAIFSSAG